MLCTLLVVVASKWPHAVEWQLERHQFSDPCCSWAKSAAKHFTEQNPSATTCYEKFIMSLHCTYIEIDR